MKTIHGILYSLMLLALFGLSGCATTYVHVGPNWDTIHNLEASEIPIKVKVYGTSSAKLGDTLKFTVTSEKSGRLWVVQVDPNDELLQLFPNNVSGTNWIDGGKSLTVPPAREGWDIIAQRPVGPSTVAFIVTDPDTDLSDVLGAQHASMSKVLSYIRTRPSWGVTHLVVDVE